MTDLGAALLALLALLALPAQIHAQNHAQADSATPPGWFDILSPDAAVQRGVQLGVMALRSRADITYGGLDAHLRAGRVRLTDLRLTQAARVTLHTAPTDRPDLLPVRLAAITRPGSGNPVTMPLLPPAGQRRSSSVEAPVEIHDPLVARAAARRSR